MTLDRSPARVLAARTRNPCLSARIKLFDGSNSRCFCLDVSAFTPALRNRFSLSAMSNLKFNDTANAQRIVPEEDNGNPSRTNR